MKYFYIFPKGHVIEEKNGVTTVLGSACPSYIVEHEEIAIEFCKEHPDFEYEARGSDTATVSIVHATGSASLEGKNAYGDVVCPFCGAKHFMVLGGIIPAVYKPTVIKDGKIISDGVVKGTTVYECLECHKQFQR